jgi:hypothetical protein
MTKKSILLMLFAAIFAASCSSDKENDNPAQEIAGKYEGYTNAGCAYFSNTVTADQTVVLTATDVDKVNVSYTSDTWGTFTINNATVSRDGTACKIVGNGSTLMGHAGSAANEYQCSITGSVEGGIAEFTFSCPSVMGGLTISFSQGEIPADIVLPDSYTGYTKADCTYFKNKYTNDEKLTVTEDNGVYSLTFESATWGTFTVKDITVTYQNGGFTISGSGQTEMGMSGSVKSYDCTLSGSVDISKSDYDFLFTVPGVMGGLTLELKPGTAPEA